MKILKIKTQRNETPEKCTYTYPREYNPMKINVLCYESGLQENYDAVVARGNTYEYLLGTVDDKDAEQFLLSKDIVEITKEEAVILGSRWTRQATKINDQEKVLQLCAKAVLGQVLTQQEKDALDPDKTESGIVRTKSFAEVMEEYVPTDR